MKTITVKTYLGFPLREIRIDLPDGKIAKKHLTETETNAFVDTSGLNQSTSTYDCKESVIIHVYK